MMLRLEQVAESLLRSIWHSQFLVILHYPLSNQGPCYMEFLVLTLYWKPLANACVDCKWLAQPQG